MVIQRLPTIEPTKQQRKWIEKKKAKTKKSYAEIMRGLIQAEIENDKKG